MGKKGTIMSFLQNDDDTNNGFKVTFSVHTMDKQKLWVSQDK